MKCPCTKEYKMMGGCTCYNMKLSINLDPLGHTMMCHDKKIEISEMEKKIITRAINRVGNKIKVLASGKKFFPKINKRK